MPESDEETRRAALEQLVSPEGGLDLEKLDEMTKVMAERKADSIARHRTPESVERLRTLCKAFHEKHEFEIGDIVRWKDGLRNKRHPDYGVPAVVWRLVDPPEVNAENSSGSQYFREQLDLIIGYFLEDGDLGTYHVDSRRFELHPDFR